MRIIRDRMFDIIWNHSHSQLKRAGDIARQFFSLLRSWAGKMVIKRPVEYFDPAGKMRFLHRQIHMLLKRITFIVASAKKQPFPKLIHGGQMRFPVTDCLLKNRSEQCVLPNLVIKRYVYLFNAYNIETLIKDVKVFLSFLLILCRNSIR